VCVSVSLGTSHDQTDTEWEQSHCEWSMLISAGLINKVCTYFFLMNLVYES
jgi:hypothetical protein